MSKISEHLKENYDAYYEKGHSEWRRAGAKGKVDNIIKLCSTIPHDTILEIGAGDGSILSRLDEIEFGTELHALEISPSGVETICRRNIPSVKKCKLFDGYNIPYENETFDIAILSHVVEHVEHPRQLLYEAARVSKHLFIEVPLEDNLRIRKDYIDDGVGHINFYSPATLRLMAQTSGFLVLNQITTNSPKEVYKIQFKSVWWLYYFVKYFLLNIFPNCSTKIFTYHGAIICKKAIDA